MDYRILGPLEVLGDDGSPVALAGVMERTLLGVLLVSANHVISTDRLIDVLWADKPPRSVNALQMHVSNLRRKLETASGGRSTLSAEHPGYVLRTRQGELDSERFEDSLRASESALPEQAAVILRKALALWRGEVLAGLAADVFLAESARLEELHLVAVERRMEAELALGRHREIVAELESAAAAQPLRERLQGELMLALYRSGRQADALAVYRRTRATLADELGIDPSAQLQELHLGILNQEPQLTAPEVAASRSAAAAPLALLFIAIDPGPGSSAAALARQESIVRAAVAAHDGREEGTPGEGVLAVFDAPARCWAAALDMQRGLAADGHPAAVAGLRMAIAADEGRGAIAGGRDDADRVARIAAVAHGGQVLVSAGAAGRLSGALPPGARLRDLGEHRLADLGRPERIFQLEADGLRSQFPPLRSLGSPALPSNLPAQASSFIGRAGELAEVKDLVRGSRLVTLTGPGGSGKTRLALQAAADMLDGSGSGVWLADLSPLSDPELVAGTVAAAVGAGIRPGLPVLDSLLDAVADKYLLVVLDNCEHLIDACAKLAEAMLRNCPRLHVLATSREPLMLDGEQVYRVPPLSLPPAGTGPAGIDAILACDAVRLFADRARGHRAGFAVDAGNAAAVAGVCARLDGIPLAIELAAARLRSLSITDIQARLGDRFALLTGGSRTALARQQTLRAAIDWSYESLNPRDRAVLDRASVFAGGFDLPLAEAVCSSEAVGRDEVVDAVGSLVDKSLVQADPAPGGGVRYRLLETIGQYAAGKLEIIPGNAAAAREAHAAALLAFAETAAGHLGGPGEREWWGRLETEADNLRLAAAHLRATPGQADRQLRFAVTLTRCWVPMGRGGEIRDLIDDGLARAAEHIPLGLQAAACRSAAFVCLEWGPTNLVHAYVERGLPIARQIGDLALESRLLGDLARADYQEGDYDGAARVADEAVAAARRSGQPDVISQALGRHGAMRSSFDPDGARDDLSEAIAQCRATGSSGVMLASWLDSLGVLELENGNLDAAQPYLEEAVSISDPLALPRFRWSIRTNLGHLAIMRADHSRACSVWLEALTICDEVPALRDEPLNYLGASLCLAAAGDHQHAAELFGTADALLDRDNKAWEPLETRLRDQHQSRLREQMGAPAFQAAYDSGRQLTPNQAMELARRELGRLAPP